MLEHTRQFAEAGIPFIFDPGQGPPMFNGDEPLARLRNRPTTVRSTTTSSPSGNAPGAAIESLATEVKALIVTRGGEGLRSTPAVARIDIPQPPPRRRPDRLRRRPPGRPAYGIDNGMDWDQTGRLASLMGAIKIASRGGQNHAPSRSDIAEAYRAAFGTTLW